MAKYRNTDLVNKNIASENNGDVDGGLSSQFSNYAPQSPPSSTPNTPGGPRMPEGFVNFDRLMAQNKDTLAARGNELQNIAQGVSNEIENAKKNIHGAGQLPTKQYGFSDILDLALKAGQGDQASQQALEAAMAPKDTAENKPVTESDAYTKGMNSLTSATSSPNAGQDNYGSGALNYALGDASYGNQVRDKIKSLTTEMDQTKNQAVQRNKEIQQFNKQLGGIRQNMQGIGAQALDSAQQVADNPGTALEQGGSVRQARQVQDETVKGMKYLAKYLGIDPESISAKELDQPDFSGAFWDKGQQKFVSPAGGMKEPTEAERSAKAIADRNKRISPEMRRHIGRIPGSESWLD